MIPKDIYNIFEGSDECVYVEEGVYKLEELKHAGYITSEEELRRKELIFQFMEYQNQSNYLVEDIDLNESCCSKVKNGIYYPLKYCFDFFLLVSTKLYSYSKSLLHDDVSATRNLSITSIQ